MVRLTGAGGNVVDHLTLGIDPAGVDAGVDTFKVGAGLVGRTFCVGGALRPALRVGVAKVAPDTGTGGATA